MDDAIADVRLAMEWSREGCDSAALRQRVQQGDLVRVRYGAYAAHHPDDVRLRHRQLIEATLPRLGPGAVLSHSSAAVLHGLPVWADELGRVHVTVERTSGGRRSRHLHVHTGPFGTDDVVVINGWLATSLARTTADLARTVALDRAVSIADAGLRLGLPRGELDLQVLLGERRRGARQLRFVVAFADPRAESVGESQSRLVFHQMKLPPPQLQYEIVDPFTGLVLARCDFGWEEHRTVGEFDGKIKYGKLLRPGQDPGDVVFGEKVREDLIRDESHEMVRWVHADLGRPRVLRERILRAFARGDRRR